MREEAQGARGTGACGPSISCSEGRVQRGRTRGLADDRQGWRVLFSSPPTKASAVRVCLCARAYRQVSA